ncbi:MAG: HipA domain-containing protein, partial [Opitutales bacterium]
DRFDRLGLHGRRGFISLRSLVTAHVGGLEQSWADMAVTLRKAGWINERDATLMERLHHFGTLIGNTDMHGGNLSFWLTSHRPLSLAPVYDMLPMRYAPDRAGDQYNATLSLDPPLPQEMAAWRWAAELAEQYWHAASTLQTVSAPMREICLANWQGVRRLREAFP